MRCGHGARDVERASTVPSSLSRALAIVWRPRSTWREIACEPPSLARLTVTYVVPLAAIGPIATYVALRHNGVRIATGTTFHASIAVALTEAITSFVFALAGVPLVAAIVRAFAPMFGARLSFARAFAISAYAFTPIWFGGALLVVPALALGQVALAVYAFFLFASGLATVGGIAIRQASFFAALALACSIASGFALGALGEIVRASLVAR